MGNPLYLIATKVHGRCDRSAEDAYSSTSPDQHYLRFCRWSVLPYARLCICCCGIVIAFNTLFTNRHFKGHIQRTHMVITSECQGLGNGAVTTHYNVLGCKVRALPRNYCNRCNSPRKQNSLHVLKL
jgi:hypothetical protein